jgi:hemerythrin
MDDFQWDCPEPVGVAQLDEQHRLMHQMITTAIRRVETRPGDLGSEGCFTEIFENMVEHFKTEEEYLENRGYPDLIPHRFEHELLLDWFQDQLVQRNAPNARPLVLLLKELAEIIQQHQDTLDRAYATWLKEGGFPPCTGESISNPGAKRE